MGQVTVGPRAKPREQHIGDTGPRVLQREREEVLGVHRVGTPNRSTSATGERAGGRRGKGRGAAANARKATELRAKLSEERRRVREEEQVADVVQAKPLMTLRERAEKEATVAEARVDKENRERDEAAAAAARLEDMSVEEEREYLRDHGRRILPEVGEPMVEKRTTRKQSKTRGGARKKSK